MAGPDPRPDVERILAIVLPLAWFSLSLTTGDAIAAALEGRSTPVQYTAAVGAWSGWAAALVALLVPRSTSLTAARIVVPAALPVTVAALIAAGTSTVPGLVGLASSAALAVAVQSAPVGSRFVNGSSYGDEDRFLLRPPTAVVAGPIQLLWTAMVGSVVAGPLLLAAGQWIAGGALVALGAVAWWIGVRSMHALARRWIVLVPAGLVVHDPMALLDTLLVQRGELVRIAPAAADTTATDLTLGATGLALQLDLAAPVEALSLTRRGLADGAESARPGLAEGTERLMVQHLLVAPTRPGALLAASAARRLPAG